MSQTAVEETETTVETELEVLADEQPAQGCCKDQEATSCSEAAEAADAPETTEVEGDADSE